MKHKSLLCFLSLQLLYPLCVLLGQLLDRPFVLASEPLYCLLAASGTVALTIRLRRLPGPGLAILTLPLTLFHALTLLLTLPWYGGIGAVILVLCGWMVFETAPEGIWRKVGMVFSVLISLGLLLISPIWLFVSAMRHEKIVARCTSPEKQYTAIVTSIDQGALGGDTLVEVRDNRRSPNLLIGRFTCSRQLWHGGWDERDNLDLRWEDETTLEISGISYPVTGEDATLIAEISHTLGAELQEGQLLEYWDDHGGFHGDGRTVAKIRCRLRPPESPYWHPFPLTKNLTTALYGGPEHSPFFPEETGDPIFPPVETGWYYFYDRHSQSLDSASDAGLYQRGSYNFTLAVYDDAAKILYYLELDT